MTNLYLVGSTLQYECQIPSVFQIHSTKWVELSVSTLIYIFNNEYGSGIKSTCLLYIGHILVNHQCGLENYNKQVTTPDRSFGKCIVLKTDDGFQFYLLNVSYTVSNGSSGRC